MNRRRALEVLGVGAAAAAFARNVFAQDPSFAKGAIIRTVLKDYAPEELAGGATLFHEHMQLAADFNVRFTAAAAAARVANGLPPLPGRGGGPPAGPDIMHNVDLMSEEVAKVKSAGVACIVDAGHPDMGRDINFIRQVSMKSGVPIVAGGGFYSQPFYPKEISTMSEEQILKALIKQADGDTLGVFGEIGSWDEITAEERKVFRAVGRAHVATNLPIFTHTGSPENRRSNSSTSWRMPGFHRGEWSSDTWGIWLTRTCMCRKRSADAERSWVSTGKVEITMRSKFRW
jgi:hypothetical protein